MQLFVKSVTWEAPRVRAYELRAPDGAPLPPFTAGAHIDMALPNGMRRSYSLVNAQEERHRYVIGVLDDRASRGGSRWIHEHLSPGDRIEAEAPRNHFALVEDAPRSVLIGGGIGITPLLSMVARLAALGRGWTLHYCVRSRAEAAFLDRLDAFAGAPAGSVRLHVDDESGGVPPDLAAWVAAVPVDSHLYCCGPAPMLAAFQGACVGRPAEQVHVEYFGAAEAPSTAGGFTVVLSRSGREIAVGEGETILDAVLAAGVDVQYSCMEGVCGSCETAVLDGLPDHRDVILTDAEKAANRTMMICCSGSRTPRLTLDL